MLRGQAPIVAMHAAVMKFLVEGKWPLLEHLDLSLHTMSPSATAHLACSNWPKLKHLELQRCSLDCQDTENIARGRWPQLQTLDLTGNHNLSASAIAQLCRGDWQRLQLLVLGSGVDAAGIASLAQTMLFSLRQLALSRAAFTRTAAQYFSCAEWPKLTCLQLHKCSLNLAGLAWLYKADLPALKLLDLTGNTLGGLEMAVISYGQWQNLETLIWAETQLGADGIAALRLSSNAGRWPKHEDA